MARGVCLHKARYVLRVNPTRLSCTADLTLNGLGSCGNGQWPGTLRLTIRLTDHAFASPIRVLVLMT